LDIEFWQERWATGQTSFHQHSVNTALERWFESLAAPPGARVFVPLCGKSLDMVWIAERGCRVVGVEVSRIAVDAFFEERRLRPSVCEAGTLQRLESGPYEIYCGDIFALHEVLAEPFDHCYDRAALIAFPPAMRPAYAQALARLLSRRSRILLLTLEYDQDRMNGPPFSVREREVGTLFGAAFSMEQLAAGDVLDREPHFRSRGLDALREVCYRLVRRAGTD
jgi:thiopurine S-methyltransferase